MNEIELYAKKIQELSSHLQETNRASQSMKRRLQVLSSTPVVKDAGGLENNLLSILPPELMPGNVGHINNVAWGFQYEIDFNLGTDIILNSNTKADSQVQVSQEAAFALTSIYRYANEYTDAGDLGPLQINIQDLQSTRFFNNTPIPIQAIGQKGKPTQLPTPLLFMPNARILISLSTWLRAGINQQTQGEAVHKFILKGFRVRVEDAQSVLSSIYG